MVLGDHENNGPEFVLVTPCRKDLPFAFGSRFGSGNLLDILYAEPVSLANLPRACILVRKSPADKFEVFSARRIGEDRNSRRDAAFDEVGRFQRSRTAGIGGYDNDFGRPNRFVDDERRSCGSQNSLPN